MNISSTSDIIAEANKLNIRPPYRQIVSYICTITEHISGFVDSILQLLLQDIPNYLKDTTHILHSLSHIGTPTPGSMLISMDVNSLYSNIPRADAVAACRTLFNKHIIQSDVATDIPILIDFILRHITFNGKYHAYIFMKSVENSFLSSFPLKPSVYCVHSFRYLQSFIVC